MRRQTTVILKLSICVLLLAQTTDVFAQVESFNIVTFSPPKDWKRETKPGVLIFSSINEPKGAFCLLSLYASRRSSGSPKEDFQSEWKELVTKPFGVGVPTETEEESTANGWKAISGAARVSGEGIAYLTMLTAISGNGRVFPILVKTNSTDYLPQVESFLSSVQMSKNVAAEASQPSDSAREGLENYAFNVPVDWTADRHADGILLRSPRGRDSGDCLLALFPMRASSGDLQADADRIFREFFKDWEFKEPGFGMKRDHPYDKISKGMSGQGWEYLRLDAELRMKRGDNYLWAFGAAFVAKLGDQVAAVAGRHSSSEPCLDDKVSLVWPKFFHSLKFKNWRPFDSPELAKQIIGKWRVFGGGSYSAYIFAANDRYEDQAAVRTYRDISPTEILEKTTGFFGSGKYTINGNELTLLPDDKRKKPQRIIFRLSNDFEHGEWRENLYLLQVSYDGGSEYELVLRRDK